MELQPSDSKILTHRRTSSLPRIKLRGSFTCCVCACDVCAVHSNWDGSGGNGVGVLDCIDLEDVTSVCVGGVGV